MSESEIHLKNYEEVLQELEKSKPNNHLLLGNGFNLSLGIKTNYESIFNNMKENNKDFESVITENFNLEEFIGECKAKIQDDNNPYSNFMKRYYHNKIKLDFMKAVTQIVTKEVKNIYQEKNEEIYLLLKQFDTFFTLNYDPFLYQLLMTFKKDDKKLSIAFKNSLPEMKKMMDDESRKVLKEIEEGYNSGVLTINIGNDLRKLELSTLTKADFTKEMKLYFGKRIAQKELKKVIEYFWKIKASDKSKVLEKIDDGFGLFGKELTFQNPKTQNLYFLHGAFHLYNKGKLIHKITQQSEKALYQRIEEIVEDAEENIICIFTDSNKETEIMQNEYLKNGLNKLTELEGAMLILGSSLADNDSHIFKKINDSKISKIYIATSEKQKEDDLTQASKFFKDKEIVLFDRDTISYMKK